MNLRIDDVTTFVAWELDVHAPLPQSVCALETVVHATMGTEPCSLLKFSARKCFKGLTIPQITKVCRQLGFVITGPKTKENVLRKGLAWALPDISEEALAKILKMRLDLGESSEDSEGEDEVPAEETTLLNSPEAIRNAAPCFDDEYMVDAMLSELAERKEKERRREAKRSARSGAASSNPEAGHAAPPENPAPVAVRPIEVPSRITTAVARSFMPQRSGIDVRLDEKRLFRWQVRYPNPVPPFWSQQVFGQEDILTKNGALKLCLEWAWRCAVEHHQMQCPWDFTPLDG